MKTPHRQLDHGIAARDNGLAATENGGYPSITIRHVFAQKAEGVTDQGAAVDCSHSHELYSAIGKVSDVQCAWVA